MKVVLLFALTASFFFTTQQTCFSQDEQVSIQVAPLPLIKSFIKLPFNNNPLGGPASSRYVRYYACGLNGLHVPVPSPTSFGLQVFMNGKYSDQQSISFDGKYYMYIHEAGSYEFTLREIGKEPLVFHQRIHESNTTIVVEVNDMDKTAIVFN